MGTATRWLIAVALTAGIAFGQQSSHVQVRVLTVCEVVADLNRCAGNAVAVVGRMERSVSLTDHSEFLSQDRCEHPVVTHGHVWLDKIQIRADWETGMQEPPSDRPRLKESLVAAKLIIVRRTTELGSHDEPQFRVEGHSVVYTGIAATPNEWAVVYGRIVKLPKLEEDCGSGGCGGDDVPLMIVAEPYNVRRIAKDGLALSGNE